MKSGKGSENREKERQECPRKPPELPVVESGGKAMQLVEAIETKEAVITGVNTMATGFDVYQSDHAHALHPENNLTFLIGTDSFELPPNLAEKTERYGELISAYYKACDRILLRLPADHKWRKILNAGKPQWLQELAEAEGEELSHVFLRPDFILTQQGVVTTEIETSPFGLALSYFLNKAYNEQGCDTMVEPELLLQVLSDELFEGDPIGKTLCFVLTDHTNRYQGQFEYLGKELASLGATIHVVSPEELTIEDGKVSVDGTEVDCVYRGFYLHESVEDPRLEALLRSQTRVVPGTKSHLEEKALMGMVWDEEMRAELETEMGTEEYAEMREIIPRTYPLSENPPEEFKQKLQSMEVPEEVKDRMIIDSWLDLAKIPKKRRNFMLKISGFSDQGSWARGVTFLNELPEAKCQAAIQAAIDSRNTFVIQEFQKGTKLQQEHYDFESGGFVTMTGKVRFTPYYSARTGQLITAKSTMCPNTDRIHASTNSINTPVKCPQS